MGEVEELEEVVGSAAELFCGNPPRGRPKPVPARGLRLVSRRIPARSRARACRRRRRRDRAATPGGAGPRSR